MNPLAYIAGDVRAKALWLYGAGGAKNVLKALVTDGTFAMLMYRLMQASQRARLAPLAMLFNKLNGFFGRCIIGRGADFGPEFVLIHSYGVVINSAVRGGRGVKLEHLVTIGAERQAAPVLGDDVFVGAGAKIIGAVRIGSGTRIGANAVVNRDVPDGATAVGIPARLVERVMPGDGCEGGRRDNVQRSTRNAQRSSKDRPEDPSGPSPDLKVES